MVCNSLLEWWNRFLILHCPLSGRRAYKHLRSPPPLAHTHTPLVRENTSQNIFHFYTDSESSELEGKYCEPPRWPCHTSGKKWGHLTHGFLHLFCSLWLNYYNLVRCGTACSVQKYANAPSPAPLHLQRMSLAEQGAAISSVWKRVLNAFSLLLSNPFSQAAPS